MRRQRDLRSAPYRLKLLAYAKSILRYYNGVIGVDIGYKYVNKEITDQISFRVYVERKRDIKLIKVAERLPREIAGVLIDVIEYHAKPHTARDLKFDPLQGGVSAFNFRRAGLDNGTLGAIGRDSVNGEALGLSNWHVLVSDSGVQGDDVFQPSVDVPANKIGVVKRVDEALDCAVCTITRAWSASIVDIGFTINGYKDPRTNMKVVKSGRSTLVTYGIVTGEDTNKIAISPDLEKPAANGQISMPGDSGSIWIEVSSRAAVALHYEGQDDPEIAFAMRMPKVVEKMRFRFA